ncbi:MAG: Smr/MutS family protein [Proteobacteria bacterium]|nr:Smr/MutS family protein [Pseudomonadota bacterium]
MIQELTLEKLQWPLLLDFLALEAQTLEGREACLKLHPNFTAAETEERWREVIPLRDLLRTGYKAPIGDVPAMQLIFRGAALGQILDGEMFWNIFILLQTVRNVHQFSADRQERCKTLQRFYRSIYPLPKLARAIEKTISPDGQLLDDASPELQRIRAQKLSMRKKIEQLIGQLLSDQELEPYIQDKFFTLRSERYVVPIRLDGRGRVKGSIHDSSDSGQTLYIELAEVRPLNDALLELESSEKIEILRIFKELSSLVAAELEILQSNYSHLIELDILTAEAGLATKLDAGSVKIRREPGLKLSFARHPLLCLQDAGKTIANSVALDSGQVSLIVSGPNAGGKTVVLKTVGILHLMAKSRLLLPCDEESEVFLFKNIFVEIGDAQNLSANLSTFSGHLTGLKPILQQSTPQDLVLLDELAVGTEPQTACAIGQAVLEELVNRHSTNIVTTHFDNLKSLALNDSRFRNGSMEFSTKDLLPTYRLILDVPGQSYGIEVAEHIGLPKHVIERAKDLKGRSSSTMDQILESWQTLRNEAEQEQRRYAQLKIEMESQKHRWEQERAALASAKQDISNKIKARYEDQLDDLKRSYNEAIDELKQAVKDQKKNEAEPSLLRESIQEKRQKAETLGRQFNKSLESLASEFQSSLELPGIPADMSNLALGVKVFIISMGKEALVSKFQKEPSPLIEVTAGLLKLRPSLHDLRLLSESLEPKKSVKAKGSSQASDKSQIGLVLPGLSNSLDLRGMDSDTAIDRTWNFIDKAVMRGENWVVLIHGHGTDTLKRALRKALMKDAPYALDFRPGEPEEGGDGVTVVQLRN